MKNGENPAYAVALNPGEGPTKHSDGSFKDMDGLTKREYFAAIAMQGLLASCADKVQSPFSLAPDAVDCADALLARLEEDRT